MSLQLLNDDISITYFIIQYKFNNNSVKGIIKKIHGINGITTCILVGSKWFNLETITLIYNINNKILDIKTDNLKDNFSIKMSDTMINEMNSFCNYKIKIINENKKKETGIVSVCYSTFLIINYTGLDKQEYTYKFIKIIDINGIVIKTYINNKIYVLDNILFELQKNFIYMQLINPITNQIESFIISNIPSISMYQITHFVNIKENDILNGANVLYMMKNKNINELNINKRVNELNINKRVNELNINKRVNELNRKRINELNKNINKNKYKNKKRKIR